MTLSCTHLNLQSNPSQASYHHTGWDFCLSGSALQSVFITWQLVRPPPYSYWLLPWRHVLRVLWVAPPRHHNLFYCWTVCKENFTHHPTLGVKALLSYFIMGNDNNAFLPHYSISPPQHQLGGTSTAIKPHIELRSPSGQRPKAGTCKCLGDS